MLACICPSARTGVLDVLRRLTLPGKVCHRRVEVLVPIRLIICAGALVFLKRSTGATMIQMWVKAKQDGSTEEYCRRGLESYAAERL